jgi:preprotein translocase subunit SecB
MSEQQEAPVFSIEKVYVKDLSLEVPNSPQCFFEQADASIEVQIQTTGSAVGEGIFDVALTVTVTSKAGEKTNFLVEVAQAGLFQIRNVPNEEIEPIVAVACPNILFPFAREAIADAIGRAGFPPILLSPVNFESIYRQRLMEAQQQVASAPHEIPVQ